MKRCDATEKRTYDTPRNSRAGFGCAQCGEGKEMNSTAKEKLRMNCSAKEKLRLGMNGEGREKQRRILKGENNGSYQCED